MQSLHLVRRQPDRNPLRFGWHGRPPASPLKVSDNRMTDALFKDMSNGFPSGQAPSNWTRSCSGQFPCRHALLPGDGAQAEAEFLHHLADPSEMYIIAY